MHGFSETVFILDCWTGVLGLFVDTVEYTDET